MRQLDEDPQYEQWNTRYAGSQYFYGNEPGPVARRAVRYHRLRHAMGGTAIDYGSGEGQDIAFLAEMGYDTTGLEFSTNGVAKTQRLLAERNITANVQQVDLRDYDWPHQYNLVLAVNSLQFLGRDASVALDRVIASVATGGVIGLSLFAREMEAAPQIEDDVFYMSLQGLMDRFLTSGHEWQMLEAANLWQWSRGSETPQAFITLIAQRLK